MPGPQRRRPTGSTPAATAAARRAGSGVEAGGRRCSSPRNEVNTAKPVRQCRRKAYPALDPHCPSEGSQPHTSSTARPKRTSASARRVSTVFFSIPRCSAICSRGIPAKRWRTKTSRQPRGSRRIARTRTLRWRSSADRRGRRRSGEGQRLMGSLHIPLRWRPPLR